MNFKIKFECISKRRLTENWIEKFWFKTDYYFPLLFERFSRQFWQMFFYWCLSDSKSPQVTSTLLSILTVHNKAVFYSGHCKIVDFAVPADHRIKLKECEKKDKCLDLWRELKQFWNMQVTMIPIVIGAFGTVTKELLKGLEDLEIGGRVETIQTTTLLITARILRRVRETWGDLLSLRLQSWTIS